MVTNETQEQLEARGWDFAEEFIPDEPTVNNQDKTVDVSENGTIEVTPDEGFTGLGKVTVNTNVQGGGSDLEYLDLSGLNEENFGLAVLSSLLKIKNAGKIGVGQTGLLINDFDELLAGAFANELRMWIGDSMVTSIKELLPFMGLSIDYDAIPRLTKEQFYDINS